MYCLSISSLCISVNVLSTRQSDETHLNNFPKDFKLPTFFSPFQRKCANLLRRHRSLYWQNSKRIILQEIVVFQIKNYKNKNTKSCFPTKVLLWHQRWISFFFFFFKFRLFFPQFKSYDTDRTVCACFNFHIFPFQSRLLYSATLKYPT